MQRRGSTVGTVAIHVVESCLACVRSVDIRWFVQFVLRDLVPSSFLQDTDVEVLNEPCSGLIGRDTVLHADLALRASAAADTVARAFEHGRDVHTKDSNFRVVFLTGEVRVITNTKGKVAFSVEVPSGDGVFSAVKGAGQKRLDVVLISHRGFATNWRTDSYLEVAVLDTS